MSVLVIGATGYIGSTVAATFAAAGHEVAALRRPGGRPVPTAYRQVAGDLTDPESLRSAAAGVDAVLHIGALPDERAELDAVEALLGSGTRLVYTSGVDVLGPGTVDEDSRPDPHPVVGWRASVERRVLAGGGLIVRPGLVYGGAGGVVSNALIPMAARYGAGVYIGAPGVRWAAVHVDDLARLFLLVTERAPDGTAWNASAETVAVDAIADVLGGGSTISLPEDADPPEEIRPFAGLFRYDQDVSSAKTRRELGWRPAHTSVLDYLRTSARSAAPDPAGGFVDVGTARAADPSAGRPKVSVIIPTYNRADYVRDTLYHLTRQSLPVDEFEVIVADDGSSDDTETVVKSFADQLRIKYHYQDDRGFRAPLARNSGARLAEAPVLVFFDSGVIAGPDCLRTHLALHSNPAERRAVIGYAYAYNPPYPMPGVAEALTESPPEKVRERFRRNPAFLDIRHVEMADCDFDPNRRATPWTLFFSLNCSVRADDYRKAGGFPEDFAFWGLEDLEVAYRLAGIGVSFVISRDAWIIESPHDRSEEANWAAMRNNIVTFLSKHPHPVIEIGWGLIMNEMFWEWETEYRGLLDWTNRVGDLDVREELDRAARRLPGDRRIAVLGAGGKIPASLPPSVLLDFDERVLGPRATPDRHERLHALGIRTPLPDQSVDTVLITSRLAGVWGRWEHELLAEAHRIGRTVHTTARFGPSTLRLV